MGKLLSISRLCAGVLTVLGVGIVPFAKAVPVFPGAVGFGTDTPAGRGGAVYRVTSLEDRGPGSLREGVENTPGPRTIIFDVSGVIRLKSDLVIRPDRGFLTIAGQTAPWPGITLANGGIAVRSHDILIQHLAIRPGDRLKPVENRDCIKIEPGPGERVHHVVIDHVSMSWAVDETFSTWGSKGEIVGVTLSNSILSEPLVNGGHPKGSHAYGPLVGRNSREVTLYRNLIAFAMGRTPLIRDETGGAQVVNNFIYRPGVWSNSAIYIGDLTLPPHAVSVVGNVIARHPVPLVQDQTDEKGVRQPHSYAATDYRNTAIYVHKVVSPEAQLYLHDNRVIDPRDGSWQPKNDDPWSTEIFRDSPDHPVKRLDHDLYASLGGVATPPIPACELEPHLLDGAGKRPAERDALDQQLVDHVAKRTGSFRIQLATGDEDPWAPVAEGRRRALALPASPSADPDGNGYTALEEWLHALSAGVSQDGRTWQASLLGEETFSNGWESRWQVEGSPTLKADDDRLHVTMSTAPNEEPAATLWWRRELPANVMIELTAGAELPVDDNAANLNLILHARETDGSAYRFGRTARYPEYQSIPNYIVTLTGGFQEGWSRVRRNPGFVSLAENRDVRSAPGETYRLRVTIIDGRVRYWLNGRLVHDVKDEHPLPGGHFALRTWKSKVWWSDVKIWALTPAAEN